MNNLTVHVVYVLIILVLLIVVCLLCWPDLSKHVAQHKKRIISPCAIKNAELTVLASWNERIKKLIRLSMEQDVEGDKMRELCAYALGDGKKLRASLVMAIAEQNRPELMEAAENAALSIEYIHAASLILDEEVGSAKFSDVVVVGSDAHQQRIGADLFGGSLTKVPNHDAVVIGARRLHEQATQQRLGRVGKL